MKRYAELTWIRNVRNADKKPHDNKLDYRGDVGVILMNHGTEPFVVEQGDRIAQLVINEIIQGVFVEVDVLTETERGAGGFGHTGTN